MPKKTIPYGYQMRVDTYVAQTEGEAESIAKEVIEHNIFEMIKKHIHYNTERAMKISHSGPTQSFFTVSGAISIEVEELEEVPWQ